MATVDVDVLGHASAAMSLNVYADLFDSDLSSVQRVWAKYGQKIRNRTIVRRKTSLYQHRREPIVGAPCQD